MPDFQYPVANVKELILQFQCIRGNHSVTEVIPIPIPDAGSGDMAAEPEKTLSISCTQCTQPYTLFFEEGLHGGHGKLQPEVNLHITPIFE